MTIFFKGYVALIFAFIKCLLFLDAKICTNVYSMSVFKAAIEFSIARKILRYEKKIRKENLCLPAHRALKITHTQKESCRIPLKKALFAIYFILFTFSPNCEI